MEQTFTTRYISRRIHELYQYLWQDLTRNGDKLGDTGERVHINPATTKWEALENGC